MNRHTSTTWVDRDKLSHVIEMFEKIGQIKREVAKQMRRSAADPNQDEIRVQDFKFYIRTNKVIKGDLRARQQ